MKTFAAIAVLATLSAAPIAAAADELGLDLNRINPNTHHGQMKIESWIDEHANEVCGPVDMPQPLDLIHYRKMCQADFRAMARAAIDRAIARNESRITVDQLASL